MPESEYRELEQKSGCKLLSPIPENGHTKVNWQCCYGHIFSVTGCTFKTNMKCRLCGGASTKTEEHYKLLANKMNIEFIGPMPKRVCHKTYWKCSCGKIVYVAYAAVRLNSICYDCGLKKITGPNHVMYNPDISQEDREKLRPWKEINWWRILVYKNYNYTCQKCKQQTGKLHAHHIFSWSKYQELRTVIENGICLCKKCHRTFHNTYGTRFFTLDNLEDYIGYKLNFFCSI